MVHVLLKNIASPNVLINKLNVVAEAPIIYVAQRRKSLARLSHDGRTFFSRHAMEKSPHSIIVYFLNMFNFILKSYDYSYLKAVFIYRMGRRSVYGLVCIQRMIV